MTFPLPAGGGSSQSVNWGSTIQRQLDLRDVEGAGAYTRPACMQGVRAIYDEPPSGPRLRLNWGNAGPYLTIPIGVCVIAWE